jgi:uncharacterized membrane protein
MDRMLVVVFDNETKAYEGKKALVQLDNEGSISAYGYAVVAKNKDGSASIKQGDDVGPLGSLGGTALGSLIGALFGPVGLAVGASAGLAGGASFDLFHAGVGDDFIDDVSKALTPGKGGCRCRDRRGLDDARGHPHGGDRRNCLPSRALGRDTPGTPGKRDRDEGRHGPAQG